MVFPVRGLCGTRQRSPSSSDSIGGVNVSVSVVANVGSRTDNSSASYGDRVNGVGANIRIVSNVSVGNGTSYCESSTLASNSQPAFLWFRMVVFWDGI